VRALCTHWIEISTLRDSGAESFGFDFSDSDRLRRVKQAGHAAKYVQWEHSTSLECRPGIYDRDFTALERVLSTVKLAVILTGSLCRPYANYENEQRKMR
jgi:hypothetical protein